MKQQSYISSPYYFVPMAEKVFYPNWQQVSLDYPLEESLSGIIEYELQNFSPLLVGDERLKDEQGSIIEFFKTPDNQYAIPGTSLKGMIRNWIEIVTHSKLSIINDTWLSYRDLRNGDYREKLTEELGGSTYKARSKAGWLKFENGEWILYPTDIWRVENKDIEDLFHIKIKDKSSEKIYEKLQGIQPLEFDARAEKEHAHSDGKRLIYAKAENLKKVNFKDAKGFLVVTGQVSNKKHMNFIFGSPKKEPLSFSNKDVIRGFLDINIEREDFKYLQGLNHQNGIPVFYILDNNGQVAQMGMAQMFRFPYEYSVGQLRYESHFDQKEKRLDFAELLFGMVDEEVNELNGRKGRVSFSLAKCQALNIAPIDLEPTVLGSPKNSFYPTYIDQKNTKNGYNTYNQNEYKLSGFKRYAIHKNFNHNLPKPPTIKGKTNYNVAVQMRPLPPQQTFSGKLRFYNLNLIELGALIYALNVSDIHKDVFHHLGMGKSYGLGKVKTVVKKLQLDQKDNISMGQLSNFFEKFLEKEIGSDKTLNLLLLLQSEKTFSDFELKYPKFQNPNEFEKILKSKGEIKLKDVYEEYRIILKIRQEEKKENERIKKIKEHEKKVKEKYNKKTTVDQLISDELGGVIDKKAIQKMEKKPGLWQKLSEEELDALITKIKVSSYYQNVNNNVRKKIRQRLGELGKKF